MLKKVLLLLLVVLAGFLTFVITRPDTFHVERTVTIAAPPEVVFARIDDLHAWGDWSPWEKLDPKMTRKFGGPESGPGASYAWAGNDKVGKGRMTIQESTRPSHVGIQLEFLEPFKATSQSSFTLAPEAAGTKVTWAMDGKNNFVSKVMCVFISMDKTVGADFEKGLASLDQVARNDTARRAASAARQAASDSARAE